VSRFRPKYESFKEKHFLEQNLRVFNATLFVFAFWNLVGHWIEGLGTTAREYGALSALVAAIIGVLAAGLIVLNRSRVEHVFLLPFGLIAFFFTERTRPFYGVFFVASLTLLTLSLVRIVIASANRLNRLGRP